MGDVSLCGGVHIVLRSAVWCVVRWWAGRGGGGVGVYFPKVKTKEGGVGLFVRNR